MKKIAIITFLLIANLIFAQEKTVVKKYSGKLDMINYISLTDNEKDVVKEITQLETDISNSQKDLIYTQTQLVELEKIAKLSSEFNDIKAKAERKYSRAKDYVSFLENDIEEYKNIQNSLLYNLYLSQLQDRNMKKKAKDKLSYTKAKSESQKLSANAQASIEASYDDVNEEDVVKKLHYANDIYKEAILKQRTALALCYNAQLDAEESVKTNAITVPEVQLADVQQKENTSLDSGKEINDAKSILDIAQAEPKIIVENHAKPTNIKIRSNIVYKVQVGAFWSKVDTRNFKGLKPVAEVENGSDYNRVLVGAYFSYSAAVKSREILVNTTNYKDAFVVAYKDGERITIEQAMNQIDDSKEKQLYFSYRNTNL